jgi:hypothetical protein
MYGLPAGEAGDRESDADSDKGDVVLPKIFRRLVAFRENPKDTKTLQAFLALDQNKKDLVIDLAKFKKLTPAQRAKPSVKNGVPVVRLSKLVTDGNRLDPEPNTLVFVEKGTTLSNSDGKTSRPVKDWNAKGVPFKP